MEDWKLSRRFFAAVSGAPLLWLLLFFIVPMAIVWGYSFGQNQGLTQIEISGTFANYAKAIEPLYLEIMLKSVVVAAITTVICFVVGFPVAMAIAFARKCVGHVSATSTVPADHSAPSPNPTSERHSSNSANEWDVAIIAVKIE